MKSMRIAWIDHELKFYKDFQKLFEDYGLEIFKEENLERFEIAHGSIDNYEGIMWHPSIRDIFSDSDRIRDYSERKPVIVLTTCKRIVEKKETLPVFSYSPSRVAEYFLQRQNHS